MKKAILILMLSIAFIDFAAGQQELGLGIKGGLNLATQHTDDPASSAKVIIGYNGGIYANYFVLNFLAVQAELSASLKGSRWEDESWDAKDNLGYIELPILVKFQPVDMFNVHAGPQFGFLFSAKQTANGEDEKTDVMEYYKKADMAFVLGIEANLDYRLNVGIRYSLGLVDVAVTDSDYEYKWSNNVLQVYAGLRIKGDK